MNAIRILSIDEGERVARVSDFARVAHGNQMRKYTNEPYWNHLFNVAATVSNVEGRSIEMIEAAFLHDTVEDTLVSARDVLDNFGITVAGYVSLLTDQPLAFGNRAARKADTVRRLATAPAQVKTIKLADLIDNAASIIEHDPDFAKVFMREKLNLLDSLYGGDATLIARVMKIIDDYYDKVGGKP